MESVSHLIDTITGFLMSPVGLVWILVVTWLGILFVWRSRRNLEEAILMEARARGLDLTVQKAQIRRVNALIVAVWMAMIYVGIQAVRLAQHYLMNVAVNSATNASLGMIAAAPLLVGIAAMLYVVFFTRSLPYVRAGKGKDQIVRLMV